MGAAGTCGQTTGKLGRDLTGRNLVSVFAFLLFILFVLVLGIFALTISNGEPMENFIEQNDYQKCVSKGRLAVL